ncbi:hypothetical protein KKH16_02965 [Patescibacteria group bacterium]|nr:hypothetical protein [Patescibacteria group bacterium]MBU1870654.1 hypothetical protein [Patescibacteria group bacterium]
MIKKYVKFFLLGLIISLIASGCAISFDSKEGGGPKADGGVYRSVNKGNTWSQRTYIPTISGQPKNFNMVNATSLVMDPGDNKAIYFSSIDNGLFYSYDGADTWQMASDLGKVTINSVAIDPGSRCIIYAAINNKLYKSTDCNRSWTQVYFDNDLSVKINTLAIDNSNNSIVYIGTSRGEIIKSIDRGNSWQTLNRFIDNVIKIIVSQTNSKLIFVSTKNNGIFRSTDAGITWINLSDKLKEFDDNERIQDLIITESEKITLFLAIHYGLLKSVDNGDSWEKIELITPKEETVINSVAVNPKNLKEIYYVTNTTFYHSIDGGQKWITKKLPSSRAGWKLLIDPKNENIIYLAMKQIIK